MRSKYLLGYLLFFFLGIIVSSAFYANFILYSNLKTSSCIVGSGEVKKEETQGVAEHHGKFLVSIYSIPIVAVNRFEEKGVVGNLTLRLIPGNSNVLIDTNPFLETDVQYSANTAVAVAKLTTNKFVANKDFVFSYNIPSQVIGGESAGAATALVTIAALEGRKIKPNVAITGTIEANGDIGRVGGILEKAKAVADAGYKVFLIPKGQSKIRYYEKKIKKEDFGFGFYLYNTYYVPRVLDISKEVEKEWGLKLIEVSNIKEAMKYMLE